MIAVDRIFVEQGSRKGKTKDNSERSCAVKDAVQERNDLLSATENRYVGYTVCDYAGEKIGKVEEFFVDDNDYAEYIGVKMGSLESRSALIPIDVVAQVDEQRQLVEIAVSKERVKDAFTLDDGSETTPVIEQQVRSFFGVANDGVLEVPPANWMIPFLLTYLREGACHGHELVRKVVDTGSEVSRPEAMYPVLQQMEKEGVIVSASDGFERELSRRRYSITQLGEAYLEYLANALMQYGEEIDLFFRLCDKQLAREPRLEHDELQSERKETRENAQVRY